MNTKLTLYQPVTYQIKAPGVLDTLWFVGDTNSLQVRVEEGTDGTPISIITDSMDQATLIGLLRRLYGLGLPLISVIWIGFVEKMITNEG